MGNGGTPNVLNDALNIFFNALTTSTTAPTPTRPTPEPIPTTTITIIIFSILFCVFGLKYGELEFIENEYFNGFEYECYLNVNLFNYGGLLPPPTETAIGNEIFIGNENVFVFNVFGNEYDYLFNVFDIEKEGFNIKNNILNINIDIENEYLNGFEIALNLNLFNFGGFWDGPPPGAPTTTTTHEIKNERKDVFGVLRP